MPTEQTTEPNEVLANIFGKRGELIELDDQAAMALSEESFSKYAAVAEANDRVLVLDKMAFEAERDLRAAVQELRDAEAAVATLPKPSRIDEVRKTLMQATAGKI